MIVRSNRKKDEFKPIELNITVESEEELAVLRGIFLYGCGYDINELAKNQTNKAKQNYKGEITSTTEVCACIGSSLQIIK